MSSPPPTPPRRIDEHTALRAIVQGTASETGESFYRALVFHMARALDTYGAWLTEYDERRERLRALSFWFGDRFVDGFEYAIAGTPCETAIREKRLVHLPDLSVGLYPGDPPQMKDAGLVSYLGTPLLGEDERVLGHLAVVDTRLMPAEDGVVELFSVFASRALAEMRRQRLEADLRERQEKLGRLIDSAMDAIVELDRELRVTLVNSAAEKLFGATSAELAGERVERLLGVTSTVTLAACADELDRRTGAERYLWIPGGLTAEPAGRRPFPAEATLSRYELRHRTYFTLILRNVDARIEAERTIRSLWAETEYLRAEIAADHGFDEIVGRSPALCAALKGVAQVAATDASVLILGETGTGKELFARAIHDRSARRLKPLVKVNCAAIPGTLIESEFFGHERGAFTGATQRREGRFALADGGTIFLDEVGELPLELQGKLLRVLQEGEFEPVGSSRTRHVDVRVLAATNRNLLRAVQDGTFREDLYYRLCVFPLELPPLRERGEDVVLLAASIAAKIARDLGRAAPALTPEDEAALRGYSWPGNVRELRNVIERALITSRDGGLNLERIVPADRLASPVSQGAAVTSGGSGPRPMLDTSGEILSERRLRQIERDNMRAALVRCGWRVAGADGAAALLGLSPSTLASRMKALGIARPGSSPQVPQVPQAPHVPHVPHVPQGPQGQGVAPSTSSETSGGARNRTRGAGPRSQPTPRLT